MRRVAEIMYIVEEERDEYLKGLLNPDIETRKVQWLCGVRKQQYFELNDYIFMTFEYDGNDFKGDMKKMASYLESKGHLINKRRKDVPLEERRTTNWWAPVKRLASLLETNPNDESEFNQADYVAMLDGCMNAYDVDSDISYAQEDWEEVVSIW